MHKSRLNTFLTLALAAALTSPADATWSIVVANRVTREIAVASATCVLNTNLLRGLPVVRVDVGAAAAQALVDGSGTNRNLIWNELQAGTDPASILQMLADSDELHESRQYGIVDSRGRSITFTGSSDGSFANGVTGQFGDFFYAIQGNVLTGMPVIAMAEAALRDTPGGLPEKLMAAMEAAYTMGGDGRCSCDGVQPDRCGSPPPDFRRSAYVGFMVVTRRGDTDGGPCQGGGSCAAGNYYLKFNARNPPRSDPVPRLRNMFDDWRAGLVGIPDAVESQATFDTNRLPNDGASTATLTIDLRDWQTAPATELTGLSVAHDPRGSAGSVSIGPITDLGGGVFAVELTAAANAGISRLMITARYPDGPDADDLDEEVVLIPSPRIFVQDLRADLNHDGVVDLADLSVQLASFGTDAAGDVDGDGDTDLSDLALLLSSIAVE